MVITLISNTINYEILTTINVNTKYNKITVLIKY